MYTFEPNINGRDPTEKNYIRAIISLLSTPVSIQVVLFTIFSLIYYLVLTEEQRTAYDLFCSTVGQYLFVTLFTCVTLAIGSVYNVNAKREDFTTLITKTGPEKLMHAMFKFRDDTKPGTDQSKIELFGFYIAFLCHLSLRKGSKSFENLYPDEYLTTKLIFENEERKQERLLTLGSLIGVVRDFIQTLS